MEIYHRSEYQREEAIEAQFQIIIDGFAELSKRVDRLELQLVLKDYSKTKKRSTVDW